jgi:hypothetical protein
LPADRRHRMDRLSYSLDNALPSWLSPWHNKTKGRDWE